MSSSLDFNKFSADTSKLIDTVFSFEKKVQNFQIKSKDANTEKGKLIGKMNEALKNIDTFGKKNEEDPDYQVLQSYKATLIKELNRVHDLVDELFNDEINYEKAMGESTKTSLPKKLEEEYEKIIERFNGAGELYNGKIVVRALLNEFQPYSSQKIDAQKKKLEDIITIHERLEIIHKLTAPPELTQKADKLIDEWTAIIQKGPKEKVKFKERVNKLIKNLKPFEYHAYKPSPKFSDLKEAVSALKRELNVIKEDIELQEKKLEKEKKELTAQADFEKRMSENSKNYAAARKDTEEEMFGDFLVPPKPKGKPTDLRFINERFGQLNEKFLQMMKKDSTLDEVNKLNKEFRVFFAEISKIDDSKSDPFSIAIKELKKTVVSMKTQIQSLKYMLEAEESVGGKKVVPKKGETERKEQKG